MSLTTDSASSPAEALTRYKADTEDHELHVLHDDGLYRHVRVKAPGTMMYFFDLITWPGCLTIRGDMGTWTFSRTEDMFSFFRSGSRTHINPGYWGEKLIGGQEEGNKQAAAYSEALWRQNVQEHLDEWLESYYENEAQATSIRAAVQADLLDRNGWDYPGNHYETATAAVRNFEHLMTTPGSRTFTMPEFRVLDPHPWRPSGRDRQQTFRFEDTYEWNVTGYSLFFLWACYAIQDGIHRYDERKAEAQADAFTPADVGQLS